MSFFFQASSWHPMVGVSGDGGWRYSGGCWTQCDPLVGAHVGTVVHICGSVFQTSQKPSWVCAGGATAIENDRLLIMKIMITAVKVGSRQQPARDFLVPRTVDGRLMVETQLLSSGCLSLREEIWPLCSDLREKKEAGKNTNHSITCRHSWSCRHMPGLALRTLPVSGP